MKEVGVAGDVEDGAFVVEAEVDGAFVVAVGPAVEDVVDTIPIIRCKKAKCSIRHHGKTATRIIHVTQLSSS
jgi:hypothetical protein